MSKFLMVDKLPETVNKGEFAISKPTFLKEIRSCSGKKPKNNIITINYIREVIATIGSKYIGDTFNAMTDVNISSLKGVPFKNEEELDVIVYRLFKKQYSKMLDAYVDSNLKSRPIGTKLIYFSGAPEQAHIFLRNGVDQILPKELDAYMGTFTKKNSTKTTSSKEDAELKQNAV